MNYFATTHTNKPSGPQRRIRVNSCDDLVTMSSSDGISIFTLKIDPLLTYFEHYENPEHQNVFQLHYSSDITNVADSYIFTFEPHLAILFDGSTLNKSKRIVNVVDYYQRKLICGSKFPDEVLRVHAVDKCLLSVLENKIFLQITSSSDLQPLNIVTAPNKKAAIGVYDHEAASLLRAMLTPRADLPASLQPYRFVSGRPATTIPHSFICVPIQPPIAAQAQTPPGSHQDSTLSGASSTHEGTGGDDQSSTAASRISSYFSSFFTGMTAAPGATSSNPGGSGQAGDDSYTHSITSTSQQTFGYMGVINLTKAGTPEVALTFPVCQGLITCITVSPDGTLIAVASDKGTLIRVYSSLDGKCLHVFRRGAKPATVCSMTFSFGNELLAVATEQSLVIHIFKLGEDPFHDDKITSYITGVSTPHSQAGSGGDQASQPSQSRRPSVEWGAQPTTASDAIPIPSTQQGMGGDQREQYPSQAGNTPPAASSVPGFWQAYETARDYASNIISTSVSTISSHLDYRRHYASVKVNVPNYIVSDMRLYCVYSKQEGGARHAAAHNPASAFRVSGWILLVFTTSGMCYAYRGGKNQGELCSEQSLVVLTEACEPNVKINTHQQQQQQQQQQPSLATSQSLDSLLHNTTTTTTVKLSTPILTGMNPIAPFSHPSSHGKPSSQPLSSPFTLQPKSPAQREGHGMKLHSNDDFALTAATTPTSQASEQSSPAPAKGDTLNSLFTREVLQYAETDTPSTSHRTTPEQPREEDDDETSPSRQQSNILEMSFFDLGPSTEDEKLQTNVNHDDGYEHLDLTADDAEESTATIYDSNALFQSIIDFSDIKDQSSTPQTFASIAGEPTAFELQSSKEDDASGASGVQPPVPLPHRPESTVVSPTAPGSLTITHTHTPDQTSHPSSDDSNNNHHTHHGTASSSDTGESDTRSSGLTVTSSHGPSKDTMSSPATPMAAPVAALEPPLLTNSTSGGGPQKSLTSNSSVRLSRTMSGMTIHSSAGTSSPDRLVKSPMSTSPHLMTSSDTTRIIEQVVTEDDSQTTHQPSTTSDDTISPAPTVTSSQKSKKKKNRKRGK